MTEKKVASVWITARIVVIMDRKPVFNAGDMYFLYAAAVKEGEPSDTCQTFRKSDACQGAATTETGFADACYTLRKGDACQGTAATETGFADARYTLRNSDSCQAAAI